MPLVLPERTDERDEIETAALAMQAQADTRTPLLQETLEATVRNAMAAVDVHGLEVGLRAGDMTLVEEALPMLAGTVLVKIRKDDESDIADPVAETFAEAQQLAVSIMPRFDMVDTRAVTFAREQAGRFLQALDERALFNTREAVAWGIENGRTVQQTSRFLRSTMYLPDRARLSIQKYFDGLIARVEKGDDLAEAARAVGVGRPLSPLKFLDAQNIDTLVDRYSDRWVSFAAETNARTMTIEASNAGLRAGWDEAADAGLFDRATATLMWYATQDDMVCPECSALNGTEVAFVGGDWEVSAGGAVTYPPAHPRCRCTLVLIARGGIAPQAETTHQGTPDVTAEHAARLDRLTE